MSDFPPGKTEKDKPIKMFEFHCPDCGKQGGHSFLFEDGSEWGQFIPGLENKLVYEKGCTTSTTGWVELTGHVERNL